MNSVVPDHFILLPPRGTVVRGSLGTPALKSFMLTLNSAREAGRAVTARATFAAAPAALRGPKIHVVDSVHEDGAKLVRMQPEAIAELRAAQPGMRIAPMVLYKKAKAPRPTVLNQYRGATRGVSRAAAGAGIEGVLLKLSVQGTNKPVVGAEVTAFTDYAQRTGAEGRSNNRGEVTLALGSGPLRVQKLFIFPASGCWSLLKENISLLSGQKFSLRPLTLSFTDALRHFYGNGPLTAGKGVKVGVVDSGVSRNHPDLKVTGGRCTVTGENPADYGDVGDSHGTHVAGIIAGRGTPPEGLCGLAPAVDLYSYRVFGQKSDYASNFDILKAIDAAREDNCDLINLSLTFGGTDEVLRAAIEDARAAGILVIAASGNDGRQPVSFPASDEMALAVTAFGRLGTFPADSTAKADRKAPFGKDKKNFVAAFSNVGIETDLTAPGVDVLSTVPGGYAPMSGTSMACPAVTGVAARLLAQDSTLLKQSRMAARSEEIAKRLLQSARSLGFAAKFEGQGLPS